MPNLLQNYPISSCNCYNCTTKNYGTSQEFKPTNMSVENCDFSTYYDCDNIKLFKSQIEPDDLSEYYPLNPEAISQLYDKSYEKIKASDTLSYPNDVYITNDPRLVSGAHDGQILALDRPPINGKVDLNKIYTDKDLNYYGKKYNSYNDVNTGQITYYIDQTLQNPIFEPLFGNPSRVDGYVYKDPMGSMKPQYIRVPVKHIDLLDTKSNNSGQLTWMRDSLESREDLLSFQMSKNNREKYSSRWTGKLFT
jgi:hypothetical protein